MKTLRRRLFQSHLTVMFVALAVLLVGVATAVAVSAIVSTGSGRGEAKDVGPFGLIVPLGAATIAAGLVSWRVAHRLAAPIESIRAATQRIAAGDYDVVVDGGDTTELAELARDVNRMANDIATTEDRRLRLIGDIGHELRNPLATIEGSLEALLDGVIEPDDETIAGLARESARLRRLAGDLSALSAASEFSVGADPVDISLIADAVAAQLRPQAVAKGLSLVVDASEPSLVTGSADRLTQVVTNIIGNAIQYTTQGEVRVAVRPGSHHTQLSVRDSGRGLAPDELERVFERFVRVDDGFTDGTGVGLTISRSLVEAHGGTLTASSRGLGQGTSFVVDLPVRL